MSIVRRIVSDLRTIEENLLAAPNAGALEPARVARRLRRVAALLADEEARWVGTTEAKRLLGVRSENTVKAWARGGLLRSRTLPNGRVQVSLDDVLERRAETGDLSAIGGDELSDEELRLLREARPGTNPWQRARSEGAP
ncbi:MAG TPA: hypothetical protein VG370_03185 [Chloroflexota bacterium]|jgi:hypothetical protein|nr:hypothetical protein [Chloroflexota bacterium]